MKGKVKFFNVTKGFGFIAGDDGKEYFVHKTGLTKDTMICENDTVTFNPVENEKGPKAENVALESAAGKTAQKEETAETQPETELENDEGAGDESETENEQTE